MTTTQLGGYGCYTLKASVLDDVRDYLVECEDEYDLLALAEAYRAQINAELEGTGITLIGDDFYAEGSFRIKMREGCPIRLAIRRADLGALISGFGKAC